ncbi:MAG: monovalent cation/H+ antiporter subunit D family protein [Alphaproteobacteria bacterium]
MSTEYLILLGLAIPLTGSVLILLTGNWPNLREFVTLATAVSLFAVVVQLVPEVNAGGRPGVTLIQLLPGLEIRFEIEPLGMMFACVSSGLWIINSFYSIGYMRAHHERKQTRFYACFALAIFGAFGVATAGNMLTLFFFYEVLTISTYPLVAHSETEEAKQSARIYLGLLMGTSIGLQLIAIVWTWFATGTLDFRDGGIISGHVEGALVSVLLLLYMYGIGKAALMPFHRWLPTAMVAPTPVSALLHAVAVVKAGVFTVLKVVIYIFGPATLASGEAGEWLLYIAGFTVIAASCVALTKDNLKARLAYSTVSQLSYIVLGAAIATPWAIMGAAMHIAMHALGKITLFFCAGAIMVATHKTNVSQMDGLGRKMPFTMLAYLIGALCVIGVPPLGGFWSKWHLVSGAFDAGMWLVVTVFLVSTLLNVAYLLPPVVRAFLLPPKPEDEAHDHGNDHAHGGDGGAAKGGIQEAPLFCVVPLCLTALGSIALFFYVEPLMGLLQGIFDAGGWTR